MKGLQWGIVGLLILCFGITACSDSDASLTAKELSNRLLEDLEFDDSELKSESAPAGSQSGPQISAVNFPQAYLDQSPQFTVTLYIDSEAPAATVPTTIVTAAAYDFDDEMEERVEADKHFVVEHQLDQEAGTATLMGNFSEDDDLAGSSVILMFALQDTQGQTGFYEEWYIYFQEKIEYGGCGDEEQLNQILEETKASLSVDDCATQCVNDYLDCFVEKDCDQQQTMDYCLPIYQECVVQSCVTEGA